MAHPHPLQEGCNRLPRADSAVADVLARINRLSDRTSSHNHSQEKMLAGSLGDSHLDSRPGWLACAALPRSGPPTTTTAAAEVASGSAEVVDYAVVAAGVGPIPAAHSPRLSGCRPSASVITTTTNTEGAIDAPPGKREALDVG